MNLRERHNSIRAFYLGPSKFMSFSHATYIHSIPTAPKVLTYSNITSKIQCLIYLRSKSHMGETQGIIHLKVKFHHRHEPVKPDKLFIPKYNGVISKGYSLSKRYSHSKREKLERRKR